MVLFYLLSTSYLRDYWSAPSVQSVIDALQMYDMMTMIWACHHMSSACQEFRSRPDTNVHPTWGGQRHTNGPWHIKNPPEIPTS